MQNIKDFFISVKQARIDTLSGLTVSLALVPEAIAFAFVAGVSPLVGLYAAFIICFLTAILGGRPGMISGATGSMAVVMVSLVADHGVQYLFAAIILTGLIQVLVGVFKLGKLVRMLPHSVMLGFVNGLAVVIFISQLGQFKWRGADGALHWLTGTPLMVMIVLVFVTMAIVYFLPKLTKVIPSSLAAILVVTAIVLFCGVDTRTVSDLASTSGGFPKFHIPMIPFTWETLKIVFPYAAILAVIGLTESLMTLTFIDEITGARGRRNRECVGQGVANVVTGFFGGMGGCAMIGQSMINVTSGGRGRLSGIIAGVCLLLIILVASKLIAVIPLAALVGVMFIVVISTFEWTSFRVLKKIPRTDAIVLIMVSVVTVFTNLAIAVLAGVIISALAYAWESAKHITISTETDVESGKIYRVKGALFFASQGGFKVVFNPLDDPENITIDFKDAKVYDHSALEVIDVIAKRYLEAGKHLKLVNLSVDCREKLAKAGIIVSDDKEVKLVV
jgi:SulP family sulfate permease